jgi:hypothetical protein
MAGEPHRTAEERKPSNNGRVFMEWIVLRAKLTGKPGDDQKRREPAALVDIGNDEGKGGFWQD